MYIIDYSLYHLFRWNNEFDAVSVIGSSMNDESNTNKYSEKKEIVTKAFIWQIIVTVDCVKILKYQSIMLFFLSF